MIEKNIVQTYSIDIVIRVLCIVNNSIYISLCCANTFQYIRVIKIIYAVINDFRPVIDEWKKAMGKGEDSAAAGNTCSRNAFA